MPEIIDRSLLKWIITFLKIHGSISIESLECLPIRKTTLDEILRILENEGQINKVYEGYYIPTSKVLELKDEPIAIPCKICRGTGVIVPYHKHSKYTAKAHEEIFPKREIDQYFALPKSSLIKAGIISMYTLLFNKRDILLLGDDDFVSLILKAIDHIRKIVVIEKDDRIVNYIKKYANEKIEIINADLRNIDPKDIVEKYDLFDAVYTDPPYGEEGAKYFIKFGSDCLKDKGLLFFLIPYHPKVDWIIPFNFRIQKCLTEQNLYILDILNNVGLYEGNDFQKSRMYVCMKMIEMPPTGKERFYWFPGKIKKNVPVIKS